MQESVALMVANLALSAWASTAFCFWKLAGAACARAARERKTKAESFAENMMDGGGSCEGDQQVRRSAEGLCWRRKERV